MLKQESPVSTTPPRPAPRRDTTCSPAYPRPGFRSSIVDSSDFLSPKTIGQSPRGQTPARRRCAPRPQPYHRRIRFRSVRDCPVTPSATIAGGLIPPRFEVGSPRKAKAHCRRCAPRTTFAYRIRSSPHIGASSRRRAGRRPAREQRSGSGLYRSAGHREHFPNHARALDGLEGDLPQSWDRGRRRLLLSRSRAAPTQCRRRREDIQCRTVHCPKWWRSALMSAMSFARAG